ncbi:MAG: 1-phosphofructokinase family hexose kinase [Chitinophagaceae bacterium]
MHKIVTVTLNPSLDKSTAVPSLVPEKKLQCKNPKLEPGGGGINVSRALNHLGVQSTALFMSGGFVGQQFNQLIQETGIDTVAFPIKNSTRENFIVVDNSSNAQYRFGMQGPELSDNEWQQPLIYLEKNTGYEYVVASGSLPPGVPVDFFGQLAAIVKKKKARLIIDTSGPALQKAVQEGVFMIKPNLGELSYLYGVDELRQEQVVLAARNIIANGGSELIVVSMGAAGAMLISATEIIHCGSPMVKRKSTVGAGDSMVAGMVYAATQNLSNNLLLKMGIACGTAATMNEGTELCKKEDVLMLYQQLQNQ